MMSTTPSFTSSNSGKGKLLILGGTGFLGQCICLRALLEGYQVTSVSRRGVPPPDKSATDSNSLSSSSSSTRPAQVRGSNIDYRKGDARQPDMVSTILQEGGYVGVIHCIGLLLDEESGLGTYNRWVSGSGSIPDENSSYDSITRISAFYAIDASIEYASSRRQNGNSDSRLPFIFTSAAEAGWPDVPGGPQIEQYLAPEWLRRYLAAKRAVEEKLLSSETSVRTFLRPVIVRPSLIYSLDRPASYLPVGAFFVGNRLGLPFVDRPVTVQSLANAIVRSLSRNDVEGVLRYPDIDALNK
jgi:nucleoside-diphosphate-sugar epimerase